MGVLGWDQRVTMPAGGGPARAEAMATLGRIAHEKFTADEIGALLEKLHPHEESLDPESDDASLIRVTRRDWEKNRKVPSELRAEMLRAGAQGHQVWVDARANNDFATFLPVLERNLELKKRYVECFEWEDSPYTPLLDDYEPFMTSTEVAEVFDEIKPVLCELVKKAPAVDAPFLDVSYDPDRQRDFCHRLAATLGFEEGSWRLDPTVHPSARRSRTATSGSRRATSRPDWGALGDDARVRARPVRARHRRLAPADAARELALARPQRVAEPDVGEPRRAQPPVLDCTGTSRSSPRSRSISATSTSTRSTRASTAPSRGSSASRRTRRRTASTSSSASTSSGS